jgi:hypothetical protein
MSLEGVAQSLAVQEDIVRQLIEAGVLETDINPQNEASKANEAAGREFEERELD